MFQTLTEFYEQRARVIVSHLSRRRGFEALGSDRGFLDLLIGLLPELLPILIGCFGGSAEKALAALQHPSLLMRVRVGFHVRRAVADAETNRHVTPALIDAIFAAARETTEAELQNAYDQAGARVEGEP